MMDKTSTPLTFSVDQYDVWEALIRVKLVEKTFHSRTAPPVEKQVLKVGDLLIARGATTAAREHELRYRNGDRASAADQTEGKHRLFALILETINPETDKGALLTRLVRDCKTLECPDGDGVKAWGILKQKATVGVDVTRVAVARRRINELRAKRMPNGVTVSEFEATVEEYQTLNAKLPAGAKEVGEHLSASLIDLMPPEADERVALMRERIAIAGGDLADVEDVLARLRAIAEALYEAHKREGKKGGGAMNALKTALNGDDLNGEEATTMVALLAELMKDKQAFKAAIGSSNRTPAGKCSHCDRAHRGPCFVIEPHLMPPNFPGRDGVLAIRKRKGEDAKPGSWESRGSPFEPSRKGRSKMAAMVTLANPARLAAHGSLSANSRSEVTLLVDSGAEVHFISDPLLMEVYSTPKQPEFAQTASNEKVPVEGIGRACLLVKDSSGNDVELTLEPAYLVPRMNVNLFSVSAAEERGVHTRFEGENIIWGQGGSIPFSRRDGGYVLDGRPSESAVAVGHACAKVAHAASHSKFTAETAAEFLLALHSRYGHVSVTRLSHVDGEGGELVKAALAALGGRPPKCDICTLANAKHHPHPRCESHHVSKCGEVVSMDISGPHPESEVKKYRYVLCFLDRFSGWIEVYFMRNRSEVPDCFRRYLADVRPYFQVERLHTDGAKEFDSAVMQQICLERGIRQTFSTPYEHQTNSQVERRWRELASMARSMNIESGLGEEFWPFMYSHAANIANRADHSRQGSVVNPYEVVMGYQGLASLEWIHPLGCKAVALRNEKELKAATTSKLDPRGETCVYLGRPRDHPQAHYVLTIETGNLRIVGDVTFDHQCFPLADREEVPEVDSEPDDFRPEAAPALDPSEQDSEPEEVSASTPPRRQTRSTTGPLPRINLLTGDDLPRDGEAPLETEGGEGATAAAAALWESPVQSVQATPVQSVWSMDSVEPVQTVSALSVQSVKAETDMSPVQVGQAESTESALAARACKLEQALDREGAKAFMAALAANPGAAAEPTYLKSCYVTCTDGATLVWSPPQYEGSPFIHRALAAVHGSALDKRTPRRYREAMNGPDAAEWQSALTTEIENHRRNGTWVVLDRKNLPPGANVVKGTWAFKIKVDAQGRISKFKGRACAQGFSQVEGVDYFDTTSPALRVSSLRALIALATARGWPLRQIDFVAAYLQASLPARERVYMTPFEGFEGGFAPAKVGDNTKVLEVRKGIYGLKQSGRVWWHTLRAWLKARDFTQEAQDPCIFVSQDKSVIIGVYVDDLVATGPGNVEGFIQGLQKAFEVEDQGDLEYILGTSVERSSSGTKVHQRRYIEDLVERYMATPDITAPTPSPKQLEEMVEQAKVGGPGHEKLTTPSGEDGGSMYRSLVCALMFAATVSRPDIAYTVGMLARCLQHPTVPLMRVARRCLAYLNGTKSFGVRYHSGACVSPTGGYVSPAAARATQLEGATDASWEERHSTSGWVFCLAGGPVAWGSKQQVSVALSSFEAETMATSLAAMDAIYLRILLEGCGVPCVGPTVLLMDNQSAIALARDPILFKKSKHIKRRHFFHRECVENGEIEPVFVPTDKNFADALTKVLDKATFLRLRERLVSE